VITSPDFSRKNSRKSVSIEEVLTLSSECVDTATEVRHWTANDGYFGSPTRRARVDTLTPVGLAKLAGDALVAPGIFAIKSACS
jgi:hypothetical protein